MYIENSSEKVGRPKEVKGRRRGFNVSVYMDDVVMEALEEIHWRERKSISELVRIAVEEYAERHKEGNSSFKIDIWTDNPDFVAVPTLLSAKETWNKYLDQCTKEERTKISIMTHFLNENILNRNRNEFRERTRCHRTR